MKKCIYCKNQIDESSVVDVCTRCGIGVWGEKMFQTILNNMEDARAKGDLFQGSVTDPVNNRPQQKNVSTGSVSSSSMSAPRTEESYFDKQKENSFGPEKEVVLQDKSDASMIVEGI